METNAKFTPGPWHWHACGGYHVLCNDTTAEQGEYPKGQIHSDGSACGEYSPDIDVNGPDAHLIAAAPDLYEASEKALSALRQYRHFFAQRGMDYPAGVDVEECVIAALTKARGEAL